MQRPSNPTTDILSSIISISPTESIYLLMDIHIPGYGFHPTHEELLTHYLKQRILDDINGVSKGTHSHLIPDINLYEWDPKELPRFFRTHSQDVPNKKLCFFFCRLNKKYRNSKRSAKTVLDIGYWKATSKERTLYDEDNGVNLGIKKTLVFQSGRAPKGERTGWVMHEYHLNPTCLGYKENKEMPFVLYRIKKKDDDEDDDGFFDQGTSSNHGGNETQALPIQQSLSGYEDQQFWGSLPSIQNLGSDFQENYDSSYQHTWMPPPSPYDNNQNYSNNWNPYY